MDRLKYPIDNQLLIVISWANKVENDLASGRQWMMKGGKGNDTFIFYGDSDKDVVRDYKPGVDSISFIDVTWQGEAVNDLYDAEVAAREGAHKVVFAFDEGAKLVLKGVDLDDLYA